MAAIRGDDRPMKADHTDLAIISLLQKDGRMPIVEIARLVGRSPLTVRKRLARLRDQKALQIEAFLDPGKFGYYHAWIGVQAEVQELQTVASRLAEFEEVMYVGIGTGACDIVIIATFKSNDDLLDFLTHKLAEVPGMKHVEVCNILKVVKRAKQWIFGKEGAALLPEKAPTYA